MPDTLTRTDRTREDVLLDEVVRLRLHLAAEQSEHQQTRAKLDAARRTADREWSRQHDEITRLCADKAHRRTWWQRARRQLDRVGTAATILIVIALVAGAVARATP